MSRLLALILCLLPGALVAQTPPALTNTYDFNQGPTIDTYIDQPVVFDVDLTVTGCTLDYYLQGFSFGLKLPEFLDPVLIDYGVTPSLAALNGGSGPDFLLSTIWTNGTTGEKWIRYGCVIDFFDAMAAGFNCGNQNLGYFWLLFETQGTGDIEVRQFWGPTATGGIAISNELVWLDDTQNALFSYYGVDSTGYDLDLTVDVPVREFVRGDVDDTQTVGIADVIAILAYLQGTFAVSCLDAADANNDGAIDVSDPSYVLEYLFNGGAAPPAPFPSCGEDDNTDPLTCNDHDCI